MSSYLILIAGNTCSGKSTLSNKIIEKIKNILGSLNNEICLISQDNYYKGGNNETNYDVPESIDFDLMFNHLQNLLNGNQVNAPVYDFTTHSRKQETVIIKPTKIIILEGILILSQEKIRNL